MIHDAKCVIDIKKESIEEQQQNIVNLYRTLFEEKRIKTKPLNK